MKLLYITNARIPTEKAHGLQIVKMCEAFQRQGLQVELVLPFRFQTPAMRAVRSIWSHYDVAPIFRIRYLITLDFIKFAQPLPEKLRLSLYYFQSLVFSTIALIVTMCTTKNIYYSRDLQTIFLLCMTKKIHRKKVFFEAHELHGEPGGKGLRSRLMCWMLQHIDGLIVITKRLKAAYTEMGLEEHNILVAPDGIDAKRLSVFLAKSEARKKLQIPLDRKVICYTGHLFEWKGVYTLAESVRFLPEDCFIYIVGGMESDIASLQGFVSEQQLKHIVIRGYVPYIDVPAYLGAADVLVLPNSAKAKISRDYTSPLKLFEYMGARRPIVASDLPSIREVLRHKENACLVQPDSPKMLADGILHVMSDRNLSTHMTETAYTEAQEYTWDRRAIHIIEFFNRKSHAQ